MPMAPGGAENDGFRPILRPQRPRHVEMATGGAENGVFGPITQPLRREVVVFGTPGRQAGRVSLRSAAAQPEARRFWLTRETYATKRPNRRATGARASSFPARREFSASRRPRT